MKSSHICNQQSAIWVYFAYTCMSNEVHYRGTTRFIIKLRMNICKIDAFNQITIESIINCLHFFTFASTYRKSSEARLPRSNEATDRITKGQAAQPTYASLANVVVPLFHVFNFTYTEGHCRSIWLELDPLIRSFRSQSLCSDLKERIRASNFS